MSSLAEELPREVERVIALREVYKKLEDMPQVMTGLQVAMMSASISEGIAAAASGDVIRILRAYEDLKGWRE